MSSKRLVDWSISAAQPPMFETSSGQEQLGSTWAWTAIIWKRIYSSVNLLEMKHFEAGHCNDVGVNSNDWQGLIEIKHPVQSADTFFSRGGVDLAHFWHSRSRSSFSSRHYSDDTTPPPTGGETREALSRSLLCGWTVFWHRDTLMG